MTVVRIDKVSYRKPIFESLYLGMPWTEIDYLMGQPPAYRCSTTESRVPGSAGGVHTPTACWRLSHQTLRRLLPARRNWACMR